MIVLVVATSCPQARLCCDTTTPSLEVKYQYISSRFDTMLGWKDAKEEKKDEVGMVCVMDWYSVEWN